MSPQRYRKPTVSQEQTSLASLLKATDDFSRDTATLNALYVVMSNDWDAELARETMRTSQSLKALLTLLTSMNTWPLGAHPDQNAINRFTDDLKRYDTRYARSRRKACSRCAYRGKKVCMNNAYYFNWMLKLLFSTTVRN